MTTQRVADALRNVLAVSDRKTDIYNEAHAALAEAATLRQAPAQGGVTEAMVDAMTEAWFAGYAMHRDSPIPEDAWSYGASRAEAEAFARKYIAALSDPEPAAQGEADACSCCGRTDALETRCMDCGEIQTVHTTAPPAQPAERVDEWLGRPLLEWALGQIDEMNDGPLTADQWGEDAGMYQQVRGFLTASPAPSEGGKGVEGDAARFRFVVEHNWIGAKTRCSEGIQDSDLASARLAVDRAMNTTGAAR